ncbi:unnamed protein product [Gongylonema pulchrum]|uniref:Peptidase_M13 domain-containing protein n=1 Tax=Gongylonema pulchrum TaxID=637853 RepID=A0A183ERS3_9BILA|nr:unnamed protein product [Gongylonema pulchrum]
MPIAVFGRPFGGFLDHPFMHKYYLESNINSNSAKTDYITQKVDNFNPEDKRTYQQAHSMYGILQVRHTTSIEKIICMDNPDNLNNLYEDPILGD